MKPRRWACACSGSSSVQISAQGGCTGLYQCVAPCSMTGSCGVGQKLCLGGRGWAKWGACPMDRLAQDRISSLSLYSYLHNSSDGPGV